MKKRLNFILFCIIFIMVLPLMAYQFTDILLRDNNFIGKNTFRYSVLSNGEYEGMIDSNNAATGSIYEAVYWDGSNYQQASCEDGSDYLTKYVVGIIVSTPGVGNETILKRGRVMNTSWAFTAKELLWLGVDGEVTTTYPTIGNYFTQCLGYAETTNIAYFDPQFPPIYISPGQ